MSRTLLAGVLLLATLVARAAEFPDGATVPSAEDFKQRLGDKKYGVTLASGITWRVEFKSNGYFFIDTSTGFRGTGEWRPENGRVCTKLRGGDENCSDGRVYDDHLHFKRADGEIIRYVPR